jgi:ATP-dependent RNA helicase DeaD
MEKTQFEQMNISDAMKKAIADIGYEEPTSIQSQSIPLALEGKDIIGHSQTGTGKTIAFGIPMVEGIDSELKATQALVLCPTRELAIQVCGEIRKLTKFKHGIGVVPIYGGQSIDRQIKQLKSGAEIVIGTPGRIMDHLRRRTLKLGKLSMVVLDEADEMLNMGFRGDIETILKDVPEDRQTILFSATMPPAIMQITKQYQKDPIVVKIEQHKLTVPQIRQYSYEVPAGNKIEMLPRLLDHHDPKLAIVFCNTKRRVDKLVKQLNARGYLSGGLHGDMSQAARTRMMKAFKSGKIDILVATDVAARGLDVDDVEAVYNYDIPQDGESYVHRIGRTGRAGKVGNSHTLVVGRGEINALKDIEHYIKAKIEQKPIPPINEVREVADNRLADSITQALKSNDFHNQKNLVDALMKMDYTSVDIACAALQVISDSLKENTPDDKGGATKQIASEEKKESLPVSKKKRTPASTADRKRPSTSGGRRRKSGEGAKKKGGSRKQGR